MALVTVATCNLDQWALDFNGNERRIRESIRAAKARGARYRVGPELEVPGYGCEDHFLEVDTFIHCWQTLVSLLSDDTTDDIVCDIGMPVLHRGVRYNCRLFCYNRRVLLIRPKLALADDGNYREGRWFTAWPVSFEVPKPLEDHLLPASLVAATGQRSAPFGVAVLACGDATIAAESCEELFTPLSPHIALQLDGVDIISNGSGSHHQLRKLNTRVDLMRDATVKGGGVYMYANQQGCDGGRLYYDGCAMVLVNGECVGQGSQFSLADVEVVVATVDLEEVRSARGAVASRGRQAAAQAPLPRVPVPVFITASGRLALVAPGAAAAADPPLAAPSVPRPVQYLTPEQEIALGPACWLWDYLRRSGAAGFFLPLSGGADSAATCALVGVMTHLLHARVAAGDAAVLADLRRVIRADAAYVPASPRAIARALMHTCYMGHSEHSSAETRARAAAVAADVGAFHLNTAIDGMVAAVLAVVVAAFSALAAPRGLAAAAVTPRFRARGGGWAEDVALQNVQARLRMVLAYMLAGLLPWLRGKTEGEGSGGGYLLVLSSGNVDEALRGYMTKYDCSSADLNPIGSIAKGDLKRFLVYAADAYGYPSLRDVVTATPTAELQPAAADAATGAAVPQTDEADMGMSYEELGVFGRLRKNGRCGPLTMYHRLLHEWALLPPRAVADKVKRFFYYYALNRHKMTTLTPAYHAESYSPDDNRYDLRQFLYNTAWDRQFGDIDADVAAREAEASAAAPAAGVPAADGKPQTAAQ